MLMFKNAFAKIKAWLLRIMGRGESHLSPEEQALREELQKWCEEQLDKWFFNQLAQIGNAPPKTDMAREGATPLPPINNRKIIGKP